MPAKLGGHCGTTGSTLGNNVVTEQMAICWWTSQVAEQRICLRHFGSHRGLCATGSEGSFIIGTTSSHGNFADAMLTLMAPIVRFILGNGQSEMAPITEGDPHMRTFDGVRYTFNGIGEFWLLRNSSQQPLALQTRMQRAGSASVITALVMQVPDSSVVQIQYSPIHVVDILVAHVPMELDRPETRSVTFNAVTVSVMDSLDSVRVAFSGIADGITLVVETGWGFGVRLSVPDTLINKTCGLFGTLDDNATNDLQSVNGTIIPHGDRWDAMAMERIHFLFGMSWNVSEKESLFDYLDKSYAFYNPPDSRAFRPNFVQKDDISVEGRDLCGDNLECLYDFVSTGGDAQFANRTKDQSMRMIHNVEPKDIVLPPMCSDQIIQPRNGFCRAERDLFLGAEAVCTCHPDHTYSNEEYIYMRLKYGGSHRFPSHQLHRLRCEHAYPANNASESPIWTGILTDCVPIVTTTTTTMEPATESTMATTEMATTTSTEKAIINELPEEGCKEK